MKLTKEFLLEKQACSSAVNLFCKQDEQDSIKILKILMKQKRLDWANWLIVRVMTYKQYVSYAVFAAEQVIGIYEKKYPNDKRPRKAIEAARKCIKNPNKKNKKAAAAYAAACAADAADAAAAAYAAACAADAAAYDAAAADAYAAACAADAAAAAYDADARKEMRVKILKYGIKLLKEQESL